LDFQVTLGFMGRSLKETSCSFVAAFLFATSITAVSNTFVSTDPPQNNDENPELLYLDYYINGEKMAGIVAVVKKSEDIWLGQSEWQNLRINMLPSDDMIREFFNSTFISIPKKFNPRVDLSNLSLHLVIPPEYLPISLVKNEMKPVVETPSEVAFYWNYLLLGAHDPFQKKANFFSHHKAVITSNFGFITNTFLARLGQNNRVVRLDNFYAIHSPKNNIHVTIGDSFTDAPSWSSSVPMLGIKIEKNYSHIPEFQSYPTLDFEGDLMTEGEIEIRMHDAKYLKKNLPMGRFFIDNPPLPIGSHFGDLIIRDAQGIARIIPFSYYSDSSILRPGLSTYSYSFGLARKNYGIASFDYEAPLFSARHKWGANNFWTPEIHLQTSLDSLLVGNEQRVRLFNFGSAGFISAINIRNSALYPLLGFDFLYNKYNINFRSSGRVAFPNFQALGVPATLDRDFRYALHSHLKIDKDYMRYTSLNHSLVYNQFYRQNAIYILQNLPFSPQWQVNINAYYDLSSRNFGFFALLSIFLDKHSVNINLEANQSLIRTASQYNFSTTTDAGNRYQFTGGVAYAQSLHGHTYFGMENQYVEGSLQLTSDKNSFTYGAQMAGALGCVSTDCFLSKPIQNGFALLQVPKRKDVTITKEFGGILGKTDSRGNLVISNLMPYEQVKLQALTRDLDPRVDTQELEKGVIIWPGHHTAHKVKLSAPLIRRIMFRLVRNGNFLLGGGSVSVLGLKEEGFFGGDGLVYLEIPDDMSTVVGKADSCSFTLALPERGDDIVENLGDVECSLDVVVQS
jgi:outer membrane usher protein